MLQMTIQSYISIISRFLKESSFPKESKLIKDLFQMKSKKNEKGTNISQLLSKKDEKDKQKTMPSFYRAYFNDTTNEFRIEDYLYKPSADYYGAKKEISASLIDVKDIKSTTKKDNTHQNSNSDLVKSYYNQVPKAEVSITPAIAEVKESDAQTESRSKSTIEFNDLKKKQKSRAKKHTLADDENMLVNIIKGLKETLETYLIDKNEKGFTSDGLSVVDFLSSTNFSTPTIANNKEFNSNNSSLNSTLGDSAENLVVNN